MRDQVYVSLGASVSTCISVYTHVFVRVLKCVPEYVHGPL